MAVTKWRMVRGVLVFCLVFLAGAFFLSAQTDITAASPLESLLNGSSTDIPGTLSSLNDADLPLALAVVEALKFKASHEEISLSRDAIDSFSRGLEARLAKASSVSISKTFACPVSMPSREQVLAGVRLTVPAHFVAVPVLTIADFGPQDEAGTPFPDIWVSFFGAKKPVVARFSLDGIPVPA